MINVYLKFNGQTREVLDFYHDVFRTEKPRIMNYGDYVPEGSKVPAEELRDWVMHAELEIYGSTVLFADEVETLTLGDSIDLSLSLPNKAEGERIFQALQDGGAVIIPPVETFYSPFHAAARDRFGVTWHLIVAAEQ